jgi:hypothetical protein
MKLVQKQTVDRAAEIVVVAAAGRTIAGKQVVRLKSGGGEQRIAARPAIKINRERKNNICQKKTQSK